MAKPARVLRWASVSGRVEPSAAEKDAGLAEGDGLPAEYLNDGLGLAGDWIDWLDDRIFDAYTVPTDAIDCRLYGSATTGLTVQNAAGTRLPVMCAEPTGGSAALMAVTLGYMQKHIDSFIAFEHDYGGSPLQVTTANKTYLPLSDYTPTVAGVSITVNATLLEFDQNGIYHVDVSIQWGAGPAAPYARSVIVDVGGTEHTALLHNEVSGAVYRTQQYSFDFEITDLITKTLRVGLYQASGSNDYAKVVAVSVHQVGARV